MPTEPNASRRLAVGAQEPKALPQQNEQVFKAIYEKRVWGREGRGSGAGSDPAFAMGCAHVLFHVVLSLNISSVVDAPCGGMAWQELLIPMLKHNVPRLRYLGVDVVSGVVQGNRARFQQWPHVTFQQQDLAEQRLPRGYELIFSRDALQHGTLTDVWRILRHFAASDAMLEAPVQSAVPACHGRATGPQSGAAYATSPH